MKVSASLVKISGYFWPIFWANKFCICMSNTVNFDTKLLQMNIVHKFWVSVFWITNNQYQPWAISIGRSPGQRLITC